MVDLLIRISLVALMAMAQVAVAKLTTSGSDFVKQLRSHCESSEFSQADYTLSEGSGAVSLIWKCPYKVALRVDGATGMEFIFNGSEAWFFYPARSLVPTVPAQRLLKSEHYTSLDNRVLNLWTDLWRSPSREIRDQEKIEELYDLSMKVKERVQYFVFAPKKPGFPKLELGFDLVQTVKIPSVISVVTADSGTYLAKLVPNSAKRINALPPKTFHPVVPPASIGVVIPQIKK